MLICRDLVTSIQDRSPYARKLYDTGQVETCLSERSIIALEEVLRDVARYEAEIRQRAKRRLVLDANAVDFNKKIKGKGKVDDYSYEQSNIGLPPVVCALKYVVKVPGTNDIVDDFDEGDGQEWVKLDIYVKNEGGGLTKFREAEEYDSDTNSSPDEPESPYNSDDRELDASEPLIMRRKGTRMRS